MHWRENWGAFPTLLRREVRRFLVYWPETLMPSLISMSLYLLIFGQVIGDRIGSVQGVSYQEFIVPGLIMLLVIMNAYENVTFSLYMARFEHSIEELLVAPVPDHVILIAYVAGGVLRGLLIGCLCLGLSAVLGGVNLVHPWILAVSALLASTIFSMAGFINALYADNFDDVSIIPIFVLTPLIYLGGVFYSVEMLPDFWRELSLLNPLLHIVSAARYGFIGILETPLVFGLGMMLSFAALLYWACLWLLHKGVGLRS